MEWEGDCYGGNNTSVRYFSKYYFLVRTAVDPNPYNESSEDSSELLASVLMSSTIRCRILPLYFPLRKSAVPVSNLIGRWQSLTR
jgi:hypothetical protein